MLSHKKYQELVEAFKAHVHDQETLDKLLHSVKDVTGYDESKKTHGQAAYEKVKARRVAKGETSWTETRKKYYQANKEELNKKRAMYKKQQQQRVAESASDLKNSFI